MGSLPLSSCASLPLSACCRDVQVHGEKCIKCVQAGSKLKPLSRFQFATCLDTFNAFFTVHLNISTNMRPPDVLFSQRKFLSYGL